jgi:tetratricopeptide (TPR) repeat protein
VTRKIVFVLAVLAGAVAPTRATAPDQPWIRAVTPNFELYTTDSEGRARETILHFEHVRAFFLKTSPTLRLPAERIRVLAFRSEREYRPFRPRESALAFYTTGAGRDTIVLQSLDSTFRSSAVHEFVHLLLRAVKAKTPLWLDEGLAQLYETLTSVTRESVRVGEIPQGRLRLLAERKWLELEELLAVDHGSRYYVESDLASLFYSESWALTHMLMLSDTYRPKGPELLDAVFSGQDAAESIEKIYGRTLRQVRQDLDAYADSRVFRVLVFPYGVEKSAEQPEIRPATPLEWGMVQADVLAGASEKRQDAKLAYEKLAGEFPASWRPPAGQAYLALNAGERETALQLFARADENGCDDARVYVDYGRSSFGTGQAGLPAKLLRKALELKPNDQEVVYQLSMALYNAREFSSALAAMGLLKSVTSGQAPDLFSAIAISAHLTGSDQMAKDAAARALKAARDDDERETIASRLELLKYPAREYIAAVKAEPEPAEVVVVGGDDAPERPQLVRREQSPDVVTAQTEDTLRRAEGLLVQVDCLGETARLWVQSGERKLGLLIPKGNEIWVFRGGEEILYDFQCGPQKDRPRVGVRYESRPDTEPGVEGVAKTVTFQ